MEWNRAPEATPDPDLSPEGLWLGRVGRYGIGPSVVVVRGGEVFEVTSRVTPTVRDVLERPNPVDYIMNAKAVRVGDVDDLGGTLTWLPPCDLQALKASAGSFADVLAANLARSLAQGDLARAAVLYDEMAPKIREEMAAYRRGQSYQSTREHLEDLGYWSPTMAAGMGIEPATLTKGPVLSAVGHAQLLAVGGDWLRAVSEPELVLAVNARGEPVGATLGNDINAIDIERRDSLFGESPRDSAAGCAIGPMIRLFDDTFGLDDLRQISLTLSIEGEDGYEYSATYDLSEMLRDPSDQVTQAMSVERGFPDGMMLFTGTPYVPMHDRPGKAPGFAHKMGDRVRVSSPMLGALENRVALSADCPTWRSGIAALMRNLAAREML